MPHPIREGRLQKARDEAADLVKSELSRVERALDDSAVALACLTQTMIQARFDSRYAAEVGQDFHEKVIAAQVKVSEARRAIVEAHRSGGAVAQDFRLRAGFGQDGKPPGDGPNQDWVSGAAPQPLRAVG